MNKVGVIFPHQLFEQPMIASKCECIYLVEETLFFRQYTFHKQKIAFHRASMKFYESYLQSLQKQVVYIESCNPLADIRTLIPYLKAKGFHSIEYIDTSDYWLEERIAKACLLHGLNRTMNVSSLFLNTSAEIESYFSNRKKFFQTDFYRHQRQIRNILLDERGNQLGGKWTYDSENRLKYPKQKIPPVTLFLQPNLFYKDAIEYTEKYFSANIGNLNGDFIYPTSFTESKNWLQTFFKERFSEFGEYEDAIFSKEDILHHSVLTPMMNVGLLTPLFVINEALDYGNRCNIPLNSLEGFIRQIIGWREFIRGVYQVKGNQERTINYWGFTRKIPASFWHGTTGIAPIDITIKKIMESGYCHHIERLMVLGNFMLLCEFDPDEVYRWFMELFIDAYDWVMVPNVYGMSQFADGGLMATKPYISGSNYLMKMSDYPKGKWQNIWDGLFWRFMHVHRSFFLQNPRLSMLIKSFDKMTESKQQMHLQNAEKFLENL